MVLCLKNLVLIKVRKEAKINYRYNQVPHLTQDTILWESDTTQERNHTQESQEASLLMFSISLWDNTYLELFNLCTTFYFLEFHNFICNKVCLFCLIVFMINYSSCPFRFISYNCFLILSQYFFYMQSFNN